MRNLDDLESSRRGSILGGRFGRKKTTTPLDRVLQRNAPQRVREASFLNRVLLPLAHRLTDPSSALMRNVDFDRVRMRLLRAGFPLGLRANDFMALKLAGVVLGVLMGFFMLPIYLSLVSIDTTFWMQVFGGIFGAFAGFKVPDLWLSMKIKKRQLEIQMLLPDMIDLITVSVEAGLGLSAALQRVSSRFFNPLTEEFTRAAQEVRLGRPNADALRDMAKRIDVSDLTIFVTALIQAETLGIAVANVLRVQSERLREKRSQRAREQAQKAPVKMVVPLVFCVFPALFVIILGPAALNYLVTGGF